jgi:hypothetical protein
MNADPSSIQLIRGSQAKSIPTSVNLERLSFESPLEHFRLCRSLLSQNVFSIPFDLAYEQLLRSCFTRAYQPSMAALALLSQRLGKPRVHLTTKQFPSGAPMGDIGGGWLGDRLLPLPIAADVASLWEELGRQDEELARRSFEARQWVKTIGPNAAWLFYRECNFDEGEAKAFLKTESVEPFGMDAHLGIVSFTTPRLTASFTLSGWNTGFGAISFNEVEVRSMGPHCFPLSDSSGFGISQIAAAKAQIESHPDRIMLNGWTQCFGMKEVWLHLHAAADQNGVQFNVRWMGIGPNTGSKGGPLAMALYVKAKTCALEDGTVLQPCSLGRYQGKGQRIVLDGTVLLECSEILNLQIIPLAGSGCFWNASFLIAFDFTSSQNQAAYSFRYL